MRYLAFDGEKTKDHLENYTKDKSPTKICCYQRISDSSDSSDSAGKDLFDDFFSFEPPSLINTAECATNIPHGNISNNEKICNNKDENNSKGLTNTVTAVTAVTTTGTRESMNYNRNVALPINMYRLYECGDTWACNKCNDKGDKWYMKKHICKMNKKQ